MNACVSLGVDLEMVFEALGGGQDLVAVFPGAGVFDADQSSLVLETMTRKVLGGSIGGIATRLGTLVGGTFLFLATEAHMGGLTLFGAQANVTVGEGAWEAFALIRVFVITDMSPKALVSRVGLVAVAD